MDRNRSHRRDPLWELSTLVRSMHTRALSELCIDGHLFECRSRGSSALPDCRISGGVGVDGERKGDPECRPYVCNLSWSADSWICSWDCGRLWRLADAR